MRRNSTHLVRIVLTVGLAAAALAKGPITYVEPFDNNVNGWELGKWDTQRREITGGRFVWDINTPDRCSRVRSQTLHLNQYEDFELAASASWLEGEQDAGFGMLWGAHYGPNLASFWQEYLRADGRLGVSHRVYKWITMVPLAASAAVRKGASANELLVRKAAGDYEFLVNGQSVAKVPFETLTDRNIGMMVCEVQKVAFDYLSVRTVSEHVPAGWEALNEGSFQTRFMDSAPVKISLARGSRLRLQKKLSGGDAAIEVASRPSSGVERWGVWLRTPDGATLQLESSGPDSVAFSAAGGGKNLGERKAAVTGDSVRLRIERRGETFRGLAGGSGGMQEVGSLKWPGLAEAQEVAFFAEYPATAPAQTLSVVLQDLKSQ